MPADTERFRDRADAGRRLAQRLHHYAGRDGVVVLGLPRGGGAVAAEVARELDAPLDVFVVRKLRLPGDEDLSFGAVATGGTRVLNKGSCRHWTSPPTGSRPLTPRSAASSRA